MSRNGKIARLPHAIREDLNLRLQNGELGIKLVEWLNTLPEVQSVLREQFEGRPINEQNMTEWKQGGYQEWLRLQEMRDWLDHVREQAADLTELTDVASPADWLSASMTFSLGRCFQAAVAEGFDTPHNRRTIMKLAHEISQLRRRDHEAARCRLEQERWKAKQEKEKAGDEWHSREPVESEPVEVAACNPTPATPESGPMLPPSPEPAPADRLPDLPSSAESARERRTSTQPAPQPAPLHRPRVNQTESGRIKVAPEAFSVGVGRRAEAEAADAPPSGCHGAIP